MSAGEPGPQTDISRRSSGWSFLEILIVVAIIAILLALAVPSYQQYLQRGHRAEAVNALLRVMACQERLRASTGFYDTTRCGHGSTAGRYRVRLEPVEVEHSLVYEAYAVPLIRSSSDHCGELGIDQSGTRSIGGESRYLADCWGGR